MNERLYAVENGENAVDISNVGEIENVLAKFIINGKYHAINDQWNGINQGDLEGYVLCQENGETVFYKIYGFRDDSKVFLDNNDKRLLNEDDRIKGALLCYCDAYDPQTNEKLNRSQVEHLLA